MILSIVSIRSHSSGDSFRTQDATGFIAHRSSKSCKGRRSVKKQYTGLDGTSIGISCPLFFPGFGSSFIFLVGLESSLSSKLLLDTMSCFPHIGDQRITRGSDEPGTADRRLGKKASGPGACFLFPRRQLSLPLTISICTSLVVPQRQQTRRLAVVSRFTPYFWYYFCCSYFGSDGYMGSLAFSLFLFSHSKSRSGTVMSGVKDSA